jgi:hypothetical protein
MRPLIAFLLVFFAQSVLAADYYWKLAPATGITAQFNSPRLACDAFADQVRAIPRYKVTTQLVPNNASNPTPMLCRIYSASSPTGSAPNSHTSLIDRFGDSCPPESTGYDLYDSCLIPEQTACEADAGRTFPYSKSSTWPDTFIEVFEVSGTLSYGAQQTACSSGCQISTISPACKVNTDGTYTCRGEAVVTGAECVSGTGNATDPGDPEVIEGETTLPPPQPETIAEEIPCTYSLDSSLGGLRCQSTQALEREGTTCGIFNGQNVCETKQPTNDKTTIDTTIVDTSNPDGSITTTKTDKATKTKCVGAKCESKESTTTSESTKDGNGSTTSSTTTCTGEACLGNSETGGDTGGECLTDCEVSSSLELPSLDEAPSFGSSMTGFIDDIQDAQMLQAVSNLNFPSGGNCSIPTAQTDVIGTLDFNIFCDMAPQILDPLEAIFLVFWGFLAIRVLLSA